MLPANTGKQCEHLLSLSATQILLAVSGPVAALLWVASRALQASQGHAACIRSTYPFPRTTERRISYLRATSLLVLFWGCPASSAWPGMKEGPESQDPAVPPAPVAPAMQHTDVELCMAWLCCRVEPNALGISVHCSAAHVAAGGFELHLLNCLCNGTQMIWE